MSEFVREVVDSINNNPDWWQPVNSGSIGFTGIKNGPLLIYGYGNTALLSVIELKINGYDQNTSYADKWKLEVAVKRWKKNATLTMMVDKS